MTTTWNPSDKGSDITLSGSDLIYTLSGTWSAVRATASKNSGKTYWEITIDQVAGQNWVAIYDSTVDLNGTPSAPCYTYNQSGEYNKDASGGTGGFYNTYTTSDIIGVALDLDNGKLWFSKNGVWQGGGDPGAGTSPAFTGVTGTWFPTSCVAFGVGASGTVNFSESTAYTVPSGFSVFDVNLLGDHEFGYDFFAFAANGQLDDHEFSYDFDFESDNPIYKHDTEFGYDFDFESARKYIHSDQEFGYTFGFRNISIPMLLPGGIVFTPPVNAPPIASNTIRPKAYVMFMDYISHPSYVEKEWYLVATALSFNISNSRTNILGSFSITIAKSDLWNPRTEAYENVFEPHFQKLVRIYYSEDNGATYTMLFEGQPNAKPESYSFGGQDVLTISGVSNSSSMQRSYFAPVEDFNGTTKQLMDGYVFKTMSDTSGGYILNFGDGYTHVDQDVGYTTALQAVNDLLKVLGPGYWMFMDYADEKSTLIVGTRVTSTQFEYNDSDIIDLNVESAMGITTRCKVIGFDEDATYTASASGAEILKHGENSLNISSGLITTLSDATILASTYVTVAQEYQKTWGISCVLNPSIGIGHSVKISSEKATLYTDGGEFITEYSHSYQVGSIPTTTVKGIYSKLV